MSMVWQPAGQRVLRKSLRGETINYRWGWFFVSFNVAENKSVFGAIAGESVSLNELGRRVAEAIADMPRFYPEVKLDEYVVMPNHVHFIIKIEDRPTNDKMHLGRIVRATASVPSPPILSATSPCLIVRLSPMWPQKATPRPRLKSSGRELSPEEHPSTRTRRDAKRPVIKVYPGGIPALDELPRDLKLAFSENRALLLSPVETGTGLNKQRANWCNEYVLRNATEVWAGPLRPGGSLEALTNAFRPQPNL